MDLPVVPGVGSGGSAVAEDGEEGSGGSAVAGDGGERSDGSAMAGGGEEGSGGAGKWVYDMEGGVAGQESKCGGVNGTMSVVELERVEGEGSEEGVGSNEEEEGVGSDEEEGVGSDGEEEGVGSDGEEEGVGSDGEEEGESGGEGVMDITVADTPKVLGKKVGKGCGQEELSVEGELEKERQLPKEVLEKLQQQRREMAAVVGSTRVRNGPLHRGPMHYHSDYAVATRRLGMTLRDVERHH